MQLNGSVGIPADIEVQPRPAFAAGLVRAEFALDLAMAGLSMKAKAGILRQGQDDLAVARMQGVFAGGEAAVELDAAVRRLRFYDRLVAANLDRAVARLQFEPAGGS